MSTFQIGQRVRIIALESGDDTYGIEVGQEYTVTDTIDRNGAYFYIDAPGKRHRIMTNEQAELATETKPLEISYADALALSSSVTLGGVTAILARNGLTVAPKPEDPRVVAIRALAPGTPFHVGPNNYTRLRGDEYRYEPSGNSYVSFAAAKRTLPNDLPTMEPGDVIEGWI